MPSRLDPKKLEEAFHLQMVLIKHDVTPAVYNMLLQSWMNGAAHADHLLEQKRLEREYGE